MINKLILFQKKDQNEWLIHSTMKVLVIVTKGWGCMMYSIMLYLRRCSVTKLRTLKGLNNWSWKRIVFKMVCVILTGEKDRRNTNLWSQRTKDPGLTFTTIYFSCKRVKESGKVSVWLIKILLIYLLVSKLILEE